MTVRAPTDIATVGAAVLTNLRVGETDLWNGDCGDGLVVVDSSGLVEHNQLSANKRANVIYFGNRSGAIGNNLLPYSQFAIDLEEKGGSCPNPDIADNFMYGNAENDVTFGSTLCPVPIPPAPGLQRAEALHRSAPAAEADGNRKRGAPPRVCARERSTRGVRQGAGS